MFRCITLIDYARPLAERHASRRHAGPYRWTPTPPGGGRAFYVSTTDETAFDEAGSSFRLRLSVAPSRLVRLQR
jgi:hypothetical protein